jgi:putative membrane protein
MFLMLKAFHIIAMVAWFAGLFYLPRLFVYHADAVDAISLERFKIMERRLYYAITWPAAVITTLLGVLLLISQMTVYMHAGWMHAKLLCVLLLWGYHLTCGYYLRQFSKGNKVRSAVYFRLFNEVPTLILISIVLLVVMKP